MRRRLHLTFPEELVRQPVVTRLVREHNVEVDVRRADVEVAVGWMIVELTGDREQLNGAQQWLASLGIEVVDASGDIVAG